jgi:EAL domain-containing protein (putative c-di-GMP-specific phosphodiesterase class I)
LKIDKSFINDIATDVSDRMLTKSIIDLAHNLDMDVIAEGVETQEQIEFLTLNGCQKVQGFYFCQAVDANTFYDYVLHNLTY